MKVTKRPYDSVLRNRQARQTQELILQAAADLVTEEGIQALAVSEVAKRAGVSLRTVWRNYPSHDALMEAMGDWMAATQSPDLHISAVDEMPPLLARLYAQWDDNPSLYFAYARWRFAQGSMVPGRAERQRQFEAPLRELIRDLPTETRRRAEAVDRLLLNSIAWGILRQELDMSGEESGKVAAWVMSLVLDDLKRLSAQTAAGAAEQDRHTGESKEEENKA